VVIIKLQLRNGAVAASYPNLTYFNVVDRGGHFAAWEEPRLFAEELRAAFTALRRSDA
jgi:pimeloyl-ACP methyl ester carboxylesterase